MANPGYVRSTDGNNADNGSTWALANADLTGAAADDAAGDTIYVSQNHAESTAGAVTITWAGTHAAPQKIICANDGAEPPTATATTATVTTTGTNAITWQGASLGRMYVYGISFSVGTSTGSSMTIQSGSHTFESCNFTLAGTGSGNRINLSNTAAAFNEFINCGFKFGASGQGFSTVTNGGKIRITGGSVLSGGTSPTTLLAAPGSDCSIVFDGFDLSNCSSSINISADTDENQRILLRNCKMPASWSGSLHSGTPGLRSIYEMIACDGGDTNYRYRRATQVGTIQEETTLVRTGGASDSTTTFSLKLVTNADAEYPMLTLDTPELAVWNDTTGSAKTATVEILHDSVTALKDDEIWLEATYLGTSGVPLATLITDCKATPLTTAANQTSSSETWTTTGMANPNKQKLSVTFTPQEKGPVYFVVRMAKASKTVYVDHEVTIS